MRKKYILLILAFLLSFNSNAQTTNGSVRFVGTTVVMQLDDDARNIIRTIENERVAGGGAVFTLAERTYVNYIVTNFKAIGVWSKITALYGFVGGTAASHKWNWKDMRDLNAAYRLVFPNGMTHSANGIQGNGTNQYAETFLTPSTTLTNNNSHISIYSNSNIVGSGFLVDISAVDGTTRYLELVFNRTTLSNYTGQYNTTVVGFNTDGKGFTLGTRRSTNSLLFLNKQSTLIGTTTETQTLPNSTTVNIGVRNSSGIRSLYSNRAYLFASIGSGLTDTEAIRMSNIVTFAQSILNRQ